MSTLPKFLPRRRFAVIAVAARLSIACGGSVTTSGDHHVGAGAPGIGGTGGKVAQLTPGSWQMTGVVTPQVNQCEHQGGARHESGSNGSYVIGALQLPCGVQLSVSGLTLQGTNTNGDGKADELSGTVSGMYWGGADASPSDSVEVALTGVPDVTAPTLKAPTGAFDPLAGFTVAASEPLASTASLTLAGTSSVPLSALPADSSSSDAQIDEVINWSASEILPLAGQWTVQGSGQDPSGHPLDLSGVLRTLADPGVFLQDGFEGPLVAAIESGTPSIVTGLGSVPAISGAHSLWIAPGDSVLFHLSRAAAEQTVHFSARAFNQVGPVFDADIRAGVIGGPPEATPRGISLSTELGDPIATGDPNWQQATGVQEFSLPLSGAGSDVLLRFSSGPCSGVVCAPPSALMIDDLTLE